MKEEEFVKKLQEMMIEEEKQRIPIAQGLPWTTDEPEVSLIRLCVSSIQVLQYLSVFDGLYLNNSCKCYFEL